MFFKVLFDDVKWNFSEFNIFFTYLTTKKMFNSLG